MLSTDTKTIITLTNENGTIVDQIILCDDNQRTIGALLESFVANHYWQCELCEQWLPNSADYNERNGILTCDNCQAALTK